MFSERSKDKSSQSSFPLHNAVRQRSISTVKKIMKKGKVSVNSYDHHKHTPLQVACFEGHFELVRTLTEDFKANIEHRDENGWTALHYACSSGHLDIAEYLIERGANVFTFTNDGDTPLHSFSFPPVISSRSLVANNNDLLFEKLFLTFLRKGVQVDKKNAFGETPLHISVREEKELYVRLLLKYEADTNAQNNVGETPLHFSARSGNMYLTRLLVEKGANPAIPGKDGTPKDVAGKCNQLDVYFYFEELEKPKQQVQQVQQHQLHHLLQHQQSQHFGISRPRSNSYPHLSDSQQRSSTSSYSSSPPSSSSFMIQQPMISEVRIVNVLQRYEKKNCFIMYPDSNKKSKKYSRAKKKCQVPSTERILAFVAANTSSSNNLKKDVILFGLKGIYSFIKEIPHFTPYSVVLETELKKRNSNPNEVHVGFNKYCSVQGMTGEETLELLMGLREAISAGAGVSNPNNSANGNSSAPNCTFSSLVGNGDSKRLSSCSSSSSSSSSSPYSSGVFSPLSSSLPEFPSVPPLSPQQAPMSAPAPHQHQHHQHHHYHQQVSPLYQHQPHSLENRQPSLSNFSMLHSTRDSQPPKSSYPHPLERNHSFSASFGQLPGAQSADSQQPIPGTSFTPAQRQLIEQQAAMLAMQLQQLQLQSGGSGMYTSPPLSPRSRDMVGSPPSPFAFPQQQSTSPTHPENNHHHLSRQTSVSMLPHNPISMVPTSPVSIPQPQPQPHYQPQQPQPQQAQPQQAQQQQQQQQQKPLSAQPSAQLRMSQSSTVQLLRQNGSSGGSRIHKMLSLQQEDSPEMLVEKIKSGDTAALNKLMMHPNHEEAYNYFLACLGSLYLTHLNTPDTNSNGRTPFHFAALSGNQQLFMCLHSLGADPTVLDFSGKTPFRLMEELLGYELEEAFSRPVVQ